jgi:hypothetical protein
MKPSLNSFAYKDEILGIPFLFSFNDGLCIYDVYIHVFHCYLYFIYIKLTHSQNIIKI